MGAKKKRRSQGKQGKSESKKAPEAPFFRPFADLAERSSSDKTAKKTKPAAKNTVKKAPKPPSPKRPPIDDPDDELAFDRLMSGVDPLDDDGAKRVPRSQAPVESELAKYARTHGVAERAAADREALDRLHALVEEGSRFEVLDDGRCIEGRRRGVDGRMVRRMRHGEAPIDATLDLHGMRVDEAREAVEAFVRDRRAKGDQVVVLVHGRGRNSPGQQPVLRGEVAAWLSEGKASMHVSAFLTAPPEHGGEGAMCVLLAHASENHRGM